MTTRPFESPESSSPIVTRAVAAGLLGQSCDNYHFPAWQKALLLGLGVLPQSATRFAISHFQMLSGQPEDCMSNFLIDDLIRTRLDDYSQIIGQFPAITVGVALGGPTTHLSLALGGPFLPQAFVVTLRGGSVDGDVHRYFERSAELSLRIAKKDPSLLTIQHYDPIHDGWLTRWVNHLRFKLLDLPPLYAEFIRKRLQPGGAVIYFEGGASWLRYRIGEHSLFQVGGWGGISAEEFLEGSERIQAFTRRSGLKHTDWRLPGYPLERGAESEWGSEPGLAKALEAFCRKEGYRFVCISLPGPHDFSRLAIRAMQHLLGKEKRDPSGVLVEMFSQFDASAARQSGLLPLWLVFNTVDSLEFLKEMRPHFPVGKPVFFSPLATFSLTPDLVPFESWSATLDGLDWTNIGARRGHYPADARALVKWVQPLRNWVSECRDPVRGLITGEELLELAENDTLIV